MNKLKIITSRIFLYIYSKYSIHYLIFSILPESEAEFTVNMAIEGRAWLVMFHHGARNVSQFLSLPSGQSWKDKGRRFTVYNEVLCCYAGRQTIVTYLPMK